MEINNILKDALEKDASDIFIIAGTSVAYRISGKVVHAGDKILSGEDTKELVKQIYNIAMLEHRSLDSLKTEQDFSFSLAGFGRFRANVYMQRGSVAAVLRNVMYDLPNPQDLNIPQSIIDLASLNKGIVLVTGSAGSGKSTTLTCMIDKINSTMSKHIITLEDPIEFLHKHKQSIISQREIEVDAKDYANALRAALRQAPDVILVGEMRDFDTINIAMTAAETGQLVLSTLHTIGAANTIDRVIDVFPSIQQHQIRIQLSMVLRAVVSQQLVPGVDGGLVPAFEVMIANNAIKTMIREEKTHQIDTIIQSSDGMQTMDTDILRLYKEGKINEANAITFASNPDLLRKRIQALK